MNKRFITACASLLLFNVFLAMNLIIGANDLTDDIRPVYVGPVLVSAVGNIISVIMARKGNLDAAESILAISIALTSIIVATRLVYVYDLLLYLLFFL